MHFARHLHTGHHDTNMPFLLLTRDQQHICMNPSHFNLIHHLHHLSHACTLITQPTTHTTDNAPEATPIGLVHTHLVTSSRVQVVLLHYKLHHIRMSFLSCPVDHVVSVIISAVEHGFHSGGKVFDHIDMATRCSFVQGIVSSLQEGKENVKHLSGTGVDMQLCMCEE